MSEDEWTVEDHLAGKLQDGDARTELPAPSDQLDYRFGDPQHRSSGI